MKLLLALAAIALWGSVAPAQIYKADYEAPTNRYPHGALGDDTEYGALRLYTETDAEIVFTLPEHLVFEDDAPRIADVTGDSNPEVIVVESEAARGARLAVYGEQGRIAATDFIGTRFRWLAPVGFGDLDGDGRIELAYVDRPHLAKTLRLVRVKGSKLVEIASWRGVSNHRFGEDFISGGLRHCSGVKELIVADSTWRQIVAVRFDGASLAARVVGPITMGFEAAMAC